MPFFTTEMTGGVAFPVPILFVLGRGIKGLFTAVVVVVAVVATFLCLESTKVHWYTLVIVAWIVGWALCTHCTGHG